MEPTEHRRDEWDFYPCRVDSAPASILVDLALVHAAPLPGLDTLYAVRFTMQDPEEHGMGSAAEASALNSVEDVLTAATASRGFCYVGRVRNHEIWQVTFMGAKVQGPALEALVRGAICDVPREFDIVIQDDPQWGYYREFLYPDAERMQWIQNRRLVDLLRQRGDVLDELRHVHHRVWFEQQMARDDFVAAAIDLGFEQVHDKVTAKVEQGVQRAARPFVAQVYRQDPVTLAAIHPVVVSLLQLAEQFGGDYDGWESPVEKRS